MASTPYFETPCPSQGMLTFTDRAREVVRSFLDQSEGELEALRIVRQPGSPVAPDFELTLVTRADRSGDEVEVEAEDFPVLVKQAEVERLEGAIVDYVERVNEQGFEVRTAPRPKRDQSAREPEGDLADQVRTVLNTQVNPAIAGHGGLISLVDMDETEVFVRMSGGCQGCALSRMTLSQGVERMLREALPQITAVHDVTDHDSGQNPYFQQ